MKIEQEARGSAQSQDAYTGPEGQLTVDFTNWDLRLHDGQTPGGHRLINRDNGDERWQGKSDELDGFKFNPEQRGFVVRLSAGNYRIRALRVNGDQLTLSNGDGYSGNPLIGLADRIETDHTFGGNLLVEGVLQVDGGINGDTSGTHYGASVGNHTGDVTGNLTGDATGNHAGSFTGDVDVRGQTLQLDAGQIPTESINGLEAFIKLHAVPMGIIAIWSGNENNVPAGWALCNGLNGTPDLRDKFIIGAGSLTYVSGASGGALTHTHATTLDDAGSHTHDITIAAHALTESEMPAHKHANGVTDSGSGLDLFPHGSTPATPPTSDSIDNNSNDGTIEGWTTTVGGGAAHSHDGSASSAAGTHNHVVNNPSSSHLPPYYALCYIMRIP